ncbi:MAG: hypothetical protein HC836_16570 [Richelia sp. RM2_1_2]|nr:hypothetical protein [Richelia sp. RM2_1_2]
MAVNITNTIKFKGAILVNTGGGSSESPVVLWLTPPGELVSGFQGDTFSTALMAQVV